MTIPIQAPLSRQAPVDLPGAMLLAMARGMHHIAQVLGAVAHRLAPGARVEPVTLPSPELHAEACAPEGAMYVDGVPFRHLDGVQGR
jgi:hypothetical protein